MPTTHSSSYFAILSDIHGNIDALDAVLQDLDRWECRGLLCLGDIVGYGSEAEACVQRLQERYAFAVIGNHEAMLRYLAENPQEVTNKLDIPLVHAVRQFSPAQQRWIFSLSTVMDLDPMTLSHTSLVSPEDFLEVDDEKAALAHFKAQTTFISFLGHTHIPELWENRKGKIIRHPPADQEIGLVPSRQYAVNVGSVGQPRDRDPRASYVLYDHETRRLQHRRVSYDIPRAQARFKKAGMPPFFIRRLARGE
jgi:predicted phosphodiesterase